MLISISLSPGHAALASRRLRRRCLSQLQLPLHRLDDDPDFRQMLQYEPDLNRLTDPQRYAQWQALRRHLVQEAVKLPPPHIIEGTQILTAPELTTGHRRILVDTPLHQIIRQYLARGRAHVRRDPARYADRNPGAPGSAAARQRALRARQIYEGLRPEIAAFRQLPGVEIVPSRAFKTWLPQAGEREGHGVRSCIVNQELGRTTACRRRLPASAALRLSGAAERQRSATKEGVCRQESISYRRQVCGS